MLRVSLWDSAFWCLSGEDCGDPCRWCLVVILVAGGGCQGTGSGPARYPSGGRFGKLLSPVKRKRGVNHVRDQLGHHRVSERRACKVLGQSRSTQRRRVYVPDDEPLLVERIIELASQYGCYGYRRITDLLRREGWKVNYKRVARLWRRESLKVRYKQPKRRRLWFNDGSCVRLRASHKNPVWSYDFVMTRTHDGRPVRILAILDESTRECLAIDVERRTNHKTVHTRIHSLG
jgi:hypothetical protein